MPNPIFSDREIDYIKSQRIARLATGAAAKRQDNSSDISSATERILIQPDVVPVGFHFDGGYFYIGGINMLKSTKYKNVLKNNTVALVIDDLKSVEPWNPRGIRVYGEADIIKRQGATLDKNGQHEIVCSMRIIPRRKWSWGINDPAFVNGNSRVERTQDFIGTIRLT
jgi:pyridoxamine 5'-phosphate oxidase family protein